MLRYGLPFILVFVSFYNDSTYGFQERVHSFHSGNVHKTTTKNDIYTSFQEEYLLLNKL